MTSWWIVASRENIHAWLRKHKKKVAGGLPFVLYSMKIKEQTRKLAAGCSKNCFEVADRTDEVSSKHSFEVVDKTDEVSYLYLRQGDVNVVWRDFRRVLLSLVTSFYSTIKSSFWRTFTGIQGFLPLFAILNIKKRGISPPYEFNSAKSSRYWLLMTAKI